MSEDAPDGTFFRYFTNITGAAPDVRMLALSDSGFPSVQDPISDAQASSVLIILESKLTSEGDYEILAIRSSRDGLLCPAGTSQESRSGYDSRLEAEWPRVSRG